MEGTRWRRWLDLLVAALLGVAALALYASTLAPTVLYGDAGEFQFVPFLLGVAHPTGYPLYALLGWLWSHLLPLGDAAYRMNLFSAFSAALAVAFLYPATRALLRQVFPPLLPFSAQRLIAILAAATFAVTPTLWSQAVIAEVYGLHAFLVVVIFYLLLTWGERRLEAYSARAGGEGEGLLLLAAFAFGLSLAHHSTTLLLAPAILAYVWLIDRGLFRARRFVLGCLLLVLLPLALYLYIPLRAPYTPYLRLPLVGDHELVLYEQTWSGFVSFVLGGPFRGSVDVSVDLGQRLLMSWGFLRDEVGYIGFVLALIGLAHVALGRPASGSARSRWAPLALTGLAFVCSVAFNLVYTIGDIYVLYIPAYLVVVLWLAAGVGTLASLGSKGRPVVSVIVVLLCFALPLWLAVTGYAVADQSEKTEARTRWERILAEPLPPGAVLVSNDRNQIMPLWYFQYVDGVRPDLLGLFPLITPDYPTLGHVLDLALSTGRPVYLIKEMPGIEVKVEVEPQGRLWRVLGSAAEKEPDYPGYVQLDDALALTGHDRAPRSPGPGETLLVSLYWEALRPLDAEYHSFVHLLDGEGQVAARSDRQPGGVYYPTGMWRPGERLRDDHLLALPDDLPAGVYRLLVGMYALTDDGTLQPLGEPAVIGQVGVKTEVPTEPGDVGQPVGASFGGQIELLGYAALPREEGLALTLYWRGLQPVDADYTVFVHLLDGAEQVIAQHDDQPQGGAYPTSVWDPGEVVVDEHLLLLPVDLPAGPYPLRVGLYLLGSGQRLPVEGGADSVDLGPIELGK
jgi:hypothetical protein